LSKKIRLVTIISRMNVGGPAVLIDGLVKNLPSNEYEIYLITGACEDNEIDYLDIHKDMYSKINIVRINKMGRSILPHKDFGSLLQLVKIIRALNPDIIHTHTFKAGMLGRIAAKIARANAIVIHTFHGHLLYGYFHPAKTRIIILLEKFLARWSDVLVAVTSQIEQDLLRVGVGVGKRWEVIHPGVDQYSGKKINTQPFSLAWVGRFTSIKNPFLAVEIMAELELLRPGQYSLTMIGEGELWESVKEATRLRHLPISFPGWQSDVFPSLMQSEALLITSKNEGLPLVMLEAASVSKVTFSTNVGGVSEFLKDRLSGYFIESEPDLAAQTINREISQEARFRRVGAEAHASYNRGFSVSSFAKSHDRLYKSFLQRVRQND
jgi:glycosyltransferase involved in cell wall biosynthesis